MLPSFGRLDLSVWKHSREERGHLRETDLRHLKPTLKSTWTQHSSTMKARIQDGIVYSPYPSADVPRCSFFEAAEKALLLKPDKTALVDESQSLTRREFLMRLRQYCAGFQKHGVRPGDRVCVHVGNSVESFVAMWGCVAAGASVVLAKPSLTERELRYQITDSDSTHILVELELAEKAARAVDGLSLKTLFATGPFEGFVSTLTFPTSVEHDFEVPTIQNPCECVLAVAYTSGTTGLPKGVELTHYSFMANLITGRWTFPWDESDVVLLPTPITHGSGLTLVTISVLLGSTCVIATPKCNLQEVSEAVEKHKVTAAFLLPWHLQFLVGEMQRTGRRLKGLRRVGTGGSPLSRTQYEVAKEAFGGTLECLANVYGMTEAMGVVCSPSMEGAVGNDIGFPAPLSQIKIVDRATGEKLGPNRTGEICFRAPMVMKGYYKRPKETAEFFDEEGWCQSGDAGYYEEDGRIHFVQRFKEMIKCMDNQVVPAELEELLLHAHSSVILDVCVFGMPNPDYVEAPTAAVVLRDKGCTKDLAKLASELKLTIAGNCSTHKHLYGGVYFLDSLPKTESGKTNRAAVRDNCASISTM